MKHLVLPEIPEEGSELPLASQTVHYLVNVRRLEAGDTLVAVDGRGGRCRIELGRDSTGRWVIGGRERLPVGSTVSVATAPLSVFVALLKGRKSDGVVRALTEIGVSRIVPVTTRRTIVRPDETGGARIGRWERIAREACEQSGRPDRPELSGPITFEKMLEHVSGNDEAPDGRALIFHETAAAMADLSPSLPVTAAAIGPEGGFAPEEISAAEARGWEPVLLPVPVLRAETAAIAVATLVQYQRSHYNRSITGSERSEWPVP